LPSILAYFPFTRVSLTQKSNNGITIKAAGFLDISFVHRLLHGKNWQRFENFKQNMPKLLFFQVEVFKKIRQAQIDIC
jgi:hypothetical protein